MSLKFPCADLFESSPSLSQSSSSPTNFNFSSIPIIATNQPPVSPLHTKTSVGSSSSSFQSATLVQSPIPPIQSPIPSVQSDSDLPQSDPVQLSNSVQSDLPQSVSVPSSNSEQTNQPIVSNTESSSSTTNSSPPPRSYPIFTLCKPDLNLVFTYPGLILHFCWQLS